VSLDDAPDEPALLGGGVPDPLVTELVVGTGDRALREEDQLVHGQAHASDGVGEALHRDRVGGADTHDALVREDPLDADG